MAEEEKKTVKKTTAKKAAAKPAPKKAAEEAAPAKKAPAKKPAAKKAAAPKPAAKKAEKKVEKPVVEKPVVTEAHAFSRDVRITPRKVRLVADLVRGKTVAEALGILAVCNRVGAKPVEKIIRSAAANATNNFGMDKNSLYVAEIQVSDGLKIKRYIPRAKGSASGIIKRNANIRVTVKAK